MIGTIAAEAAECRARFADVKVGSWVRCCHHEILAEQLEEPPENRIAFILALKPAGEQARRLHEFAPIPPEMAADYWPKLKPIDDDYDAKLKIIDDDYWAKRKIIDDDYDAKRKIIDDDYDAKLKIIDDDYDAKLKPIRADYRAKRKIIDDDYWAKRKIIEADYEAKLKPIRADYQAKIAQLQAPIVALVPHTTWTGDSIFPSTQAGG